ncbi:hypothetical protein AB0D49_18670 [Streptomyces sp. NPDC048290]|uniref:hypothetical protein n=1 Tax=Streptomyces sp. NPDC048290 TaxID=3155811 RepID=UPI00342F4D8B
MEQRKAAALADRAQIIARYRAFEPLIRIADTYRVSPSWLRDRLDAWGEPRRPRYTAHLHRRAAGHVFRGRAVTPRTTDEIRAAQAEFIRRRDDVIGRYQRGASVTSLAREFKVSPTWVGERLDAWDVPRRNRPPT